MVGGGAQNSVGMSEYAAILGGSSNTIDDSSEGDAGTIAGGEGHLSLGDYTAIGGGLFNTVDGVSSTCSGGAGALVSGNYGTITSGLLSYVLGDDALVAGTVAQVAEDRTAAFGFSAFSGQGCSVSGTTDQVKFCVDDAVYVNGVPVVTATGRRLSESRAVAEVRTKLDAAKEIVRASDAELVIAEQEKMLHAARIERRRLVDRLATLEQQTDAVLAVLASRS